MFHTFFFICAEHTSLQCQQSVCMTDLRYRSAPSALSARSAQWLLQMQGCVSACESLRRAHT